MIEGVHLFEGVTNATMGHGEGWQYLQTGRFLERADATAALVDLHFHGKTRLPATHLEWVGLLRSCSALEAYCRHYTADLRPERIAEFLLLNPEFPRSVRFAANRVESALRSVAQYTTRGVGGRAERLAGRLHASLDYGQVGNPERRSHLSAETPPTRATGRIRIESWRASSLERVHKQRRAHHPPRDEVHLRDADQRASWKSVCSRAARGAAVQPLRAEHGADLAREDGQDSKQYRSR